MSVRTTMGEEQSCDGLNIRQSFCPCCMFFFFFLPLFISTEIWFPDSITVRGPGTGS